MKLSDALVRVNKLALNDVIIFTKNDLGVVFQEHGETLSSTLKRLIKYNVLLKIANGLYFNKQAKPFENILYRVAAFLRPSDVNYLSNESVLCNLSIISQQMLDRITVMTTGRSGVFKTPFGVVESITRGCRHEALRIDQPQGTDQRLHAFDANFSFSVHTSSPKKPALRLGKTLSIHSSAEPA